MAKSDPDRIIRLLPFAVGGIGGTFLLINRLSTLQLTDAQARSDVVGVILCGFMVLIGLIWQRIQPKAPDQVMLIGEEGIEWDETLPDDLKIELAWASHLLLTNTATQSLAIYYQGKTLLRRGILGKNKQIIPGAILKRVLDTTKPIYLVDLKLYPGRVEFDYLPENVQGMICQPLGKEGAMILAANAPRSYTKQDEAWISGIADKLSNSLVINSNPS
ncbi:MAG: cofactor assembly of complex C subunit B [Microcystaceae cyanobacterium]